MKPHFHSGLWAALCLLVCLSGCMSNETEHTTSNNEEMVRLKADNKNLNDSIGHLSARISALEQMVGTPKVKKGHSKTETNKATAGAKTYNLFDTLKISSIPRLLPSTCKWRFKDVENNNPSAGDKDCSFNQSKNIIYLDNRECSLDDIKRTRDYEFPPAAVLSTPCPNMDLVLECR